MKFWIFFELIIATTFFTLFGCGKVNVSAINKGALTPSESIIIDPTRPDVSINKAVDEVVGSCTFIAITEPTVLNNFSYRITFSKPIISSTLTTDDFSNIGTGGSIALAWEVSDCGDNKNFRLTVTDVEGNGTIRPVLDAGKVSEEYGNSNTASTSTNNTITLNRTWSQEAYIKAINNTAGDNFGEYLSLNGETLVVGTPKEGSAQVTITNIPLLNTDNTKTNSGAVYVYKRTGPTWSQEAFIKAGNADANDNFGIGISLYKDTLAVGAYGESSNQIVISNDSSSSTNNTKANSGAVYIYRRTGSSWSQEAYIKAVNADGGDYFGDTVALSGDTLAVGAFGELSGQTSITNGDTASSNNILIGPGGAIYIYTRVGNIWSQQAYIKAQNGTANTYFGSSISLDNNTLVAGVDADRVCQNYISNTAPFMLSCSYSGAAFVYRRTGNIWAQEAFIKASGNESNLSFGKVVSLNNDTIAVTALYDSNGQTTITNGSGYSFDSLSLYSGAV